MLMKLLEDEKPTHFLFAFDAGKITFRHDDYKDYKGGRPRRRRSYQSNCH